MNKILVVGGAGNIGTALLKKLSKRSDLEFIIIDNFSTSETKSNNLTILNNFELYKLDFQNLKDFKVENFSGISRIIHLAAYTDMTNLFQKQNVLKNNHYSLVNSISLALKFDVPLLFTSTTSVYSQAGFDIDESSKFGASFNEYIISKQENEMLLSATAKERSLKFNIVRFGTIHGVTPNMKFHTAVNKFCWQAYRNEQISLWVDSLCTLRPYLGIQDAIHSIELFIDDKMINNEVYNVATKHYTPEEIVDIISNRKSVKIDIVNDPRMTSYDMTVSTSKIEKIGFTAKSLIHSDIIETLDELNKRGISGRI